MTLLLIWILYHADIVTTVAQWLRCCATNRNVAGSIPADVIDIISVRPHYGPGIDSGSNRNEYQEHFLGVKAAGAKTDMKSGNLNFLEPSGPLQACNRTDLSTKYSEKHAKV